MRAVPAWVDKVHDRDKIEQCIYDLCFHPDGSQLVVAAGQRVLVYDTSDGSLVQPLKGHKDTVYCVGYARDGKRFASGSADKNVIIWTSKLEGVLKYSHNDAVQCLAYNPVSHHLASCALTDFAFWSPEQKAVQKHKAGGRINACAWTNDGQFLALGLQSGVVSLRGKGGEERGRVDPSDGSPVSALAWSPEPGQVLCVANWAQKLSFYSANGKPAGKERSPGGSVLSASFLPSGEFLLVGGTDRRCSLLTRDGIRLGSIGDVQASWVWCCAARPDSSFVAVGCQDGTIACYQLLFSTVHGLYKERYAFRENMTDVIIQHLLTEQKVRIKCRDLIKKIAIYKNRLAVQLSERAVIYELYAGDTDGMHYRVKEKINRKLDCNLLVVCTNHLVLCLEKKLQCIAFSGQLEREWLMDSPIRYIKVIGGPEGQEGLLLGLKNGQVCKIFLGNGLPVNVLKIASAVRCLDVSRRRKRLAIVDENNQCLVYDIATKELLFQEPDANSVAWNSQCEDMLCFSGGDVLSIKTGSFPAHRQPLPGFVVGFCGSKVFCLHAAAMATVEVPLSTPMYQHLEQKQFRPAYHVACLGVPAGDWDALALAALEGLDLETAQLALRRTKDFRLLTLLHEFQQRTRGGAGDLESLRADLLAFQGRFREAAQLYKREHREQDAIAMFSDLRMFDQAQLLVGAGDGAERRELLRKRAQWAREVGEPRTAAEMLFSAGEAKAAIDLAGQHGWTDMLCELVERLAVGQTDELSAAAGHLRRLGLSAQAASAYTRVGDLRSVAAVYVEAGQWEDAFALAQNEQTLRADVFVPFAHFLAENDRFAEAQAAFQRAGRPAEALAVLETLTQNAVSESRFLDAGYYHWLLARHCLELAREGTAVEADTLLLRYRHHDTLASVYYAFEPIRRYIDEPFTTHMADGLFNIARFVLHEIKETPPPGVSQFAVMHTLAKQARNLGAFKLAHELLARIQRLVVPLQFQDSVDLAAMTIKAKPYSDGEELLPMCYRCSTFNPLLSKTGNVCCSCRQPFVHSFITFEITPLVEFRLDAGIDAQEAVRLVEGAGPGAEPEPAWKPAAGDGFQALRMDEAAAEDPFTARLMDFESVVGEFVPVTVDREILRAMDPRSVLVCRGPEPLPWRFYRNILPDLQISLCSSCHRAFYLEDFELHVLEKGHCPFCRTPQLEDM